MSKLLILASVLLIAPVGQAEPTEALKCAMNLYQYDADQGVNVLLVSDTIELVKGVRAVGFFADLSVEVLLDDVDSVSADLTVHVTTVAARPHNDARSFDVEFDLPARLDSLIGKAGELYSLSLVPLEAIEIDQVWCPFKHYEVADFSVDASTHLDIYYVPQSLGDFYWNSIKGMMEEQYNGMDRLLHFSMPGKPRLYVCPCPLPSVIWDHRFGMMVDPARGNMFSVFSPDFNSTYPFLLSQALIFSNYGYAPAFFSEGLANYLSFAIHDMKKMVASGGPTGLDSLLDTYAYSKADPLMADRISATFVHYLVDQFGIGKYLEVYRAAHDLNQRQVLRDAYGMSIAELETGWLQYVDTVTLAFGQYDYYASQAEAMLDYRLMKEYGVAMSALATTRADSLKARSLVTRAAFFSGDYYKALETQLRYLEEIDTASAEWVKLAGYRMMTGEYRQARADLERAAELDSTNRLADFNLALNSLYQGDSLEARLGFQTVVSDPAAQSGWVESQIMLAGLMARSDRAEDRAEAVNHFQSAVGVLSRQNQRHNASASQVMWLGIAFLGLDDTGNAYDYLHTAGLLASRLFYRGMIELWLGKVADIRGERAVAIDHYQRVLAGSSAHYHQVEARALIDQPYRQ